MEALALLERDDIDIVLLDLNMPGLSGHALIARMRAHKPSVPILVLSMHNTAAMAAAALQAGAAGYVTKDSEPEVLIEGVRKVAAGGHYLAPALAQTLALHRSLGPAGWAHEQLSEREQTVFHRLVAGDSVKEIADALHISNKTVSTHKARLMEKLQAGSTADLVRYALEHQLVR